MGSYSQQRSSPIHEASLVDPSLHSPALLELLDIKLSRPVFEYVVDCVIDTVDCAMGRPSTSARGRRATRSPRHIEFSKFVTNVLTRAEVTIPVVLVALAYVDRAKPHLHIALEEWACERVFLGAVMLASKYLNDSTLKNVHWALCTGVFGKRDVGRIERELLDVLDFELGVVEDDILSHHDGLSAVTLSSHSHRAAHSHSHRHHNTHHIPLPPLSPSSSESSSSSSASPQTPEPLEPVPFAPKAKNQLEIPRVPHSKPSITQSTLDLLQSFPIPMPHSHSEQKHYSSFSLQNHHASRFNSMEQAPRPQIAA